VCQFRIYLILRRSRWSRFYDADFSIVHVIMLYISRQVRVLWCCLLQSAHLITLSIFENFTTVRGHLFIFRGNFVSTGKCLVQFLLHILLALEASADFCFVSRGARELSQILSILACCRFGGLARLSYMSALSACLRTWMRLKIHALHLSRKD
jgi:hypothetical protein